MMTWTAREDQLKLIRLESEIIELKRDYERREDILRAELAAVRENLFNEMKRTAGLSESCRRYIRNLKKTANKLALRTKQLVEVRRENKALKALPSPYEWVIPAITDHLRFLGCKCPKPLIGYSPTWGPRCRLCGVDSEDARERAEELRPRVDAWGKLKG